MPKVVNAAPNAKAKTKAWTFEAKAVGFQAKAKAIQIWLQDQGLALRTTSLH